MNLSGPFIRRPVATSLLAAAVILAGAAAYQLLPVAPLPKVDFPSINVNASLPGASPSTMASAVATPLERRFGRIAGLNELTSSSSQGGTSITMQFDLDRDVTGAARDVQAAINAAGGELPTNLPTRPNFRKVNPADSPILILGLTSKALPLAQVFEAANTILAQKISQVDGVGQVFVGGGQQPAVRVQMDLHALAGMGLGTEDVRNALSQATANVPKGALNVGGTSFVVRANDQLFGAAAFRNVVIATRNGASVRLGDVAQVFDDVENQRVAGWLDGTRAVVVMVRRQPGANILATIERVKAILPELATSISPAIHIEVAVDRAQTIRASVADVELTLVVGVLLVVLVVFGFLRSWRATLVPSVAIPLSLFGTFAVMYLIGFSLDNLSLMALTISTGFVVDDAIVVTENITRHLELGLPLRKAALEGARQIGFTIVSITVSLLAVFIPILLMGGIVGRLFREFAVTLGIAVAISAVVSLTVTPMMASRLLRAEPPRARDDRPRRGLARLTGALESLFDGTLRGYTWALDRVLKHPVFGLLLAGGMIALTVFLFAIVPKGLFPQQDTGVLMGFSEASQDISFPAMKKLQEDANRVVGADPDVAHVISFLGAGPSGGTTNAGSFFVALKPKPERKTSADLIIARLRPKLAHLAGLNVFLQAVQDVRVGGRSSRTQYQYTLEDADLSELQTFAPKVLEAFRALPDLKDVATDMQAGGLELDVALDRDTASRLGITPTAVDAALYNAFGQRQVAVSYSTTNFYRVVLESRPDQQTGPDALRDVFVTAADGSAVPLSALSKVSIGKTPLSVNHQGQFPAVTLSFNLAPGRALGDAVAQIHAAEVRLGFPGGLRGRFAGTAQAFGASLDSEPWLILAALVAVYIVLGMLYESLVHPLTILSTLPSAGVGALAALLICGTEFSLIALIGVILLIGIVKKNAIMLVDFAIEARRERGLDGFAAIREACLARFRPILMTTLAALLGGLPLALGSGTGAELRRPLGIAIVGGLMLSQAVTLFTTPVVYLWLDRWSQGWQRFRAKRRARHEDAHNEDAHRPALSV